VYYRLSYLISYLLFREKGLLIFKGGLSGVRYQTPKNRVGKPNLSPYAQNNYRIEVKNIFLEIVHKGLSCEFFSDFSFFRHFATRLKISDIES